MLSPEDSRVSLKVYNLIGQEVAMLLDGIIPAGYKSVRWDASNAVSDVYFYRLQAARVANPGRRSFTRVKKMLLIR